MRGHEFVELTTFVAVARHRSFSKAAAEIGVSAATVSQAIRTLETNLGIRLLNRTTRSVAVTEAGEELLSRLQPALDSVDEAIQVLSAFRGRPIGTMRLNVGRVPAKMLIAPLIARFIEEHPDINLEVAVDDSGSDIVSGRFDAGIRIGSLVEQDMIAVRLTDEFRLVTAASSGYLKQHGLPIEPKDVAGLPAVRFRLPWNGTVHRWLFERGGERVEIAVNGPLTVNDISLAVRAAIDGVGMVYLPEDWLRPYFADGRLVALLEDWAPSVSGFYLYYSSNRQMPPALRAFIDFVHRNVGKTARERGQIAAADSSNGRNGSLTSAAVPLPADPEFRILGKGA